MKGRDEMKEIFKDIFFEENGTLYDYRGLYQVSNFGRVKSFHGKEKFLKLSKKENGYMSVSMYKNGKEKRFYVHRLVAHMFIQNNKNFSEINHVDENKENNFVTNLEWCNRSQNINHGTRNEKCSEKQKNNEKSIKIVQMKNFRITNIFSCCYEAERITGINHGNINKCCRGNLKSAGKFIWKYLYDVSEEMLQEFYENQKK